jgi:hypothetical protein
MLLGFLVMASIGTAISYEECPIVIGRYTVGFETSYLVPYTGPYRGRKIWIEKSNIFDKYFKRDNKHHKIWKSAEVKIQGCVKRGSFGALGLYQFSIESFNLIHFISVK